MVGALVTNYAYSTQPFLAWCLNHHFYNQTHYVWAAQPFYPYRLANPKSSNPYLIYRDLYEPWQDRDPYDKFILQFRLNLRAGAEANAGGLPPGWEPRLKTICDRIDTEFFYPLVYRIDLDAIGAWRQQVAGSGLRGSSEVLMTDLKTGEFAMLFNDYVGGQDYQDLKGATSSPSEALGILERNCR